MKRLIIMCILAMFITQVSAFAEDKDAEKCAISSEPAYMPKDAMELENITGPKMQPKPGEYGITSEPEYLPKMEEQEKYGITSEPEHEPKAEVSISDEPSFEPKDITPTQPKE